jgi:hypothetical protein
MRLRSVDIICGDWEAIESAKPLRPFADNVLDFFSALSKKLVTARAYSDVVTFGFWCREAALLREKARYDDLDSRFGRGVAFHIAPSNVPVNFAFSLAAGLLAGNANIARLPSKDFEQIRMITGAINELLAGGFSSLAPYICVARYPINKEISDRLSAIADTRIIWGGDVTIAKLRESPLKPRASEITFADRHSIAVIHADEYLAATDKDKIAKDFYNDTYFSDQNACTSPRVVFWLGRGRDEAKQQFYAKLRELAARDYTLPAARAVGKLTALYKAAVGADAVAVPGGDNLVARVTVNELSERLMDYKYNSGFFLERDIESLDEISPVCDARCQTLSYYGVAPDEITRFMLDCRPHGIDRVVPVGRTMEFSLVWDGHDLIRELSRKVSAL